MVDLFSLSTPHMSVKRPICRLAICVMFTIGILYGIFNSKCSIVKGDVGTKNYDVLLSSYMRSGSTITGHLLGHRDDAFYFYEPLLSAIRYSYFNGQDAVCQVLHPYCNEEKGIVHEALRFMGEIYTCSFNNSDTTKRIFASININFLVKRSGRKWETFLKCKGQNRTYHDCVPALISVCRTAKHRVSKVIRLSLDNTESLLYNNPRLKVVHFFRDPRGIINSQIKAEWFPFSGKSQEAVRSNAKALCLRMMNDVKAAEQLTENFPNRVMIVRYEDFSDTMSLAKYLYDFVGMEFTEQYKTLANTSDTTSATAKTDGYHSFMYRDMLSWNTVRTIDSVCKDVYKALGYMLFDSEGELKKP